MSLCEREGDIRTNVIDGDEEKRDSSHFSLGDVILYKLERRELIFNSDCY